MIQTKLKSASRIVTSGMNVTIVKHNTVSAENALCQRAFEIGSIISPYLI
jgi:hypothetical protein